MSEVDREQLLRSLDALVERGVQADRRRLKEDMCAQFTDHREWVREFVANAYDAGARHVWISGAESAENLTIRVADDGHGMDRQGVLDFMTVYRSRKGDGPREKIGCHGIGKLSIAAIPGQCGFRVVTSTGQECWRMETGALLDEKPIRLERLANVPPTGSCFEVDFRKRHGLREELRQLRKILHGYVRFLPLEVILTERQEDGTEQRRLIHEDWRGQVGVAGRAFAFTLEGRRYEATFGLGDAVHELYQNRVLISNQYNLLSRDLERALELPYLCLRVDSPDFELPFGRHRLRDEEVLKPLSHHLRTVLLPQYFHELYNCFRDGEYADLGVPLTHLDDITCRLLEYDAGPSRIWSQWPVFADAQRRVLSLNDLRQIVAERGVIYLESADGAGMDYTVFDAPVLSLRQRQGALELIQRIFANQLVNLSLEEVVMEAPQTAGRRLGPVETRFQRMLRFHPQALREARRLESPKGPSQASGVLGKIRLSLDQIQRLLGVCQEVREARSGVEAIQWRVSYLVGRDAKTPCRTHRFLLRDKKVILNLHHPEVAQLLRLSEQAPALAGHWGLAMCLNDSKKLLPHLSAEAREDLLLADALAKCECDPDETATPPEAPAAPSWDFLREAREDWTDES